MRKTGVVVVSPEADIKSETQYLIVVDDQDLAAACCQVAIWF